MFMTELVNALTTDADMQQDTKTVVAKRLFILALDDDPGVRHFYVQSLEQAGHEVVAVESGRTALQVMMQNRFDVMIVDIRMPEMNGVVFLREALKVWPWVGVVVVSGFAHATVVEELRALGVTRILHKPVPLEALLANVVAAAADCPKPVAQLPGAPLMTLMKDHLKMLSLAEGAPMGTGSLADTLNDFVGDLAFILPCDMLGMLVAEADRPVFLAYLCRPVARSFIDSVRDELLSRYQVISGHALSPSFLDQHIVGENVSSANVADVGQTLSVPVILGDDVCAMLTLATRSHAPYSPSDVSLLYLAANHVGAVVLALRKMRMLAIRDGLTGLYNRLRIEEELSQAWQASRRYGKPMAVVVLDIDHFKVMNDTYGHAVGDLVLRDFAKLLRASARASDLLGRFGGDEFVAILPQATLAEARVFCERLLLQTRNHVFCAETHRLNLTISIGVAICSPHAVFADPADLLSQADRALYQAKRNGRDRLCVWDDAGVPTPSQTGSSLLEPLPKGKARAHVLLVDDDPAVLRILHLLLEAEGFEVDTVNTAAEAIASLKRSPGHYDIVMTDLSMPGVSGLALLKQVASLDNLVVTLVMTGHAEVENAIACLREGAVDLLLKPIQSKHLYASMRRAMALRSLKLDNLNHQRHLEQMVAQRSRQLQHMLEDVKQSYAFTLEAFMAILDAREQQTGRHSLRVRELAIWLARRMGVHGAGLEAIATGALLHDIGKIGVPDRILLSPDALGPDARKIMQGHADIGAKILTGSPRLADAAQIVAEHHERFDGSGYPKGLQGEAICLGARIFAVVDTYDAMRSDRPYRQALSEEEAVQEILSNSGTQFDPAVVNVFVENRAACDQLFQQLNDDSSLRPTVVTESDL